jgi:phage terminase large subunit-like protein
MTSTAISRARRTTSRSRATNAAEDRRQRTDDPVAFYARQVVSGRISAGRFVRAACQRHLDDLKHGHKRGLYFSNAHAKFAIRFFSQLCHSKGVFRNRPLNLELWQEFRIGCVFGWRRSEDGSRRFRTAFNDVARKNGKTTEAAGVGLFGLTADNEPGAEVYSAATKKDQAKLCFNEAKRMARSAPGLRERVVRRTNRMSVATSDSFFEPLSADADTLDGLNPHFVILDELHKHKSRAVLDVMDTAVGARRQPLIWIITTAGTDDPETVYAQEREYAEKVVLGALKDDDYFAYIATIDEDDRWDDETCWIKANPNLGVSVNLRDLKRQATKARGAPAAQREFKRLRLNVRTASAGRAVAFERWMINTLGPIDESTLWTTPKRVAYLGLDLSTKTDLTAAVLLVPPLTKDERFTILARFWCPEENVFDRESRDGAAYSRWIEEGWIEPTPGDVIDFDPIKNQCLEWARQFELRGVPYDPWNATQTALELQREGLPVVEFIQGIRSYSAPTAEFIALVQAKRFEHGANPVLGWMVSNLKVETDKNQNKMPHKKKSTGRIDGMTALIMALGAEMKARGTGKSFWETSEPAGAA